MKDNPQAAQPLAQTRNHTRTNNCQPQVKNITIPKHHRRHYNLK
jgi:hypothetical protein